MKLQGKTALITGAACRIGREIALMLASRGVLIVIHYDRSRQEALRLQNEIMSLKGQKAFLVRANFSSGRTALQTRIKTLLKDVHKKVPHIDILINNAAIFYPTPLGEVTEKKWDDYISINLKAPFFLAQELGRKMLKKKCGKIINLVDWTAQRPAARFIPYAASKAGLVAVTQGLAKALAPHVQTLGISPGPILPVKGSSEKERQSVADRTLLKRYGNPSDIAQTIRFFCEDTDYITGAIIPVDGGASLV